MVLFTALFYKPETQPHKLDKKFDKTKSFCKNKIVRTYLCHAQSQAHIFLQKGLSKKLLSGQNTSEAVYLTSDLT